MTGFTMKWKAASHTEAEKILRRIAKSGIRVLDELDVHVELHHAGNDGSFENCSNLNDSPGVVTFANYLQFSDSATVEVMEEKEAASR